MKYEEYLINFVKAYLPIGGELLISENSKTPVIYASDLDKDGIVEIIVGYTWREEVYIMILKSYYNLWYLAANFKGEGHDVNYLKDASIISERENNLIIGWQYGAIWSKLNIYQWTSKGIVNRTPQDIYYSKIEVEDMPGVDGKDGKEEIALWGHDTGDAYKIEVFRWVDGKLQPATDVYSYYFKRVVAFYEEKVKEMPDAAFYWYYLADAQLKAEMPEKALVSVEKAISLNNADPSIYPPRETLLKLREEILSKLNSRDVNEYDTRNDRQNKLFPAPVNTIDGVKWGYIDSKGKFIINPKYNSARDFQDNGIAIVEARSLYGLIDVSGRYIIEPKYETINEFSEGRAAVVDKEGFKVIDETGKELTSKAYNYIGSYTEGRAMFTIEDSQGNWLYGFLDRNGREAIPAKYKSANDFNDGKAVVKVNEGEYNLIGVNGEILNSYRYSYVGSIGDGLLPFREKDESKFGFIDEAGNIVIEPQFTGAQAFKEGRAVVNAGEDFTSKYGLIDKSGKYIIEPLYNDIQLLWEERVAVGRNVEKDKPYMGSRYAIADMNGNFLTDFIYSQVLSYKDGVASAYDDKNTFFIDKGGNKAEGLPIVEGSGSLSIEENIIRGNIDLRTMYLRKDGTLIYKQNTIILLSNRYRIIEEKYKPNKDYLVYYPKLKVMDDEQAQKSVNEKLKELSQIKEVPGDVQLENSYTGDFSIEFFKKNLLVLELNGYDFPFGAAHGMPSLIYPHIDLVTGKFYELEELFKNDSNYVKVLSDIIENEIKTNEEYSYVWIEDYKGIRADQPFYINKEALYIYFYPYEIAPYAAGFPTFKIEFDKISNIIDVNGEFWRAFN